MTGTDEKLTALGIEKMLEDYFDLIYTQNMDLFDRVFHPSAVLYSAQDGVVVARPREEYRELMRARRSPSRTARLATTVCCGSTCSHRRWRWPRCGCGSTTTSWWIS